MTTKVFAKPTDSGLKFLSTTFDATDTGDARPNMDPATYEGTGWLPVVRVERPATDPGYMTVFSGWVVSDAAVTESWDIAQRPQPFPSWSWVEGEGWVAPTPKPGDEYDWDEATESWVLSDQDV